MKYYSQLYVFGSKYLGGTDWINTAKCKKIFKYSHFTRNFLLQLSSKLLLGSYDISNIVNYARPFRSIILSVFFLFESGTKLKLWKIVFSVERELQSRTFIKLLNFEEKLYYYLLKLLFMCVPLKSLQIVRVYYEEMVLHMEIVLLMDIASFY